MANMKEPCTCGGDAALCQVSLIIVITFCVSRRRRKMYRGHASLSVCVCVCVSVCPWPYAHTTAHFFLHRSGCNFGAWYRLSPSCALLRGFAIGAQVALLWQHNANPSYKLAYIPRYDDIVQMVVWGGLRALLAADWRAFSKLHAWLAGQ